MSIRVVVEYLGDKGILFPKMQTIDPLSLNIRSKIEIYKAIDLKSNYCAIIYLHRKSRFLQKDAQQIEVYFERLKQSLDHNFKKKLFIIQAPLCSKAKKNLQANRWTVFEKKETP